MSIQFCFPANQPVAIGMTKIIILRGHFKYRAPVLKNNDAKNDSSVANNFYGYARLCGSEPAKTD